MALKIDHGEAVRGQNWWKIYVVANCVFEGVETLLHNCSIIVRRNQTIFIMAAPKKSVNVLSAWKTFWNVKNIVLIDCLPKSINSWNASWSSQEESNLHQCKAWFCVVGKNTFQYISALGKFAILLVASSTCKEISGKLEFHKI